jgi:hypothetical protein
MMKTGQHHKMTVARKPQKIENMENIRSWSEILSHLCVFVLFVHGMIRVIERQME